MQETNLYPDTKSSLPQDAVYSGDYLLQVGFSPDVRTGRACMVPEIKEVR